MRIEDEIKQAKFKSNLQKALINLDFTSNWLGDLFAGVFKKHNILVQHYNVMRIVNGRKGKPSYPGDIKAVMLDKGRDLTRLVDKLVNMGILKRGLCEENRRKMEIYITAKGVDLMNVVDEELSKLTQEVFNMSEEEAGLLSDLLDKVRG